jgi:hypothetical protein
LACPDENAGGGGYFNFELKNMFDLYDKDHDGAVNHNEFLNILLDTFK